MAKVAQLRSPVCVHAGAIPEISLRLFAGSDDYLEMKATKPSKHEKKNLYEKNACHAASKELGRISKILLRAF